MVQNEFLVGLLLGLASLPVCFVCYIILIPPLLMDGEGRLRSSLRFLSFFAAGRLLGYISIGAVAGLAASSIPIILGGHILAVAYLALAVMLLYWAIRRTGRPHSGCSPSARNPFLFGLFHGLSLCPPFIIGIIVAMQYGSVLGAIVLFLGFFIGATTPIFLLSFSGMLSKFDFVRRIGLLVSVLLAFGLVGEGTVLLAQNGRIRTERERVAVFKRLLPDAVSFSGNLGRKNAPPYYAAYDKDGRAVAVLFFTDEVAPEVEGYAGRVPACVACDVTLRIKAVEFLPNDETQELVAEMFEEKFARQYLGKTYMDEFKAGKDVEGISGATYTTDAINRSIKLSLMRIAAAYRPEDIETHTVSLWSFDGVRTAVISAFFALAVVLSLLAARKIRLILLAASVTALGYHLSAFMLTTENITNIFVKKMIPQRVEFIVLIVGIVITSFLFGRLYCGYICPFGAVSELLWRILPFKQRLSTNTAKRLRWVKYALLLALIVLASVGSELYFAGSLEPFATTFLGVGGIPLLLVGIILLLSAFFFRFYCRFLCPVGAVMELLGYVRIIRRKSAPISCKLCTHCVETCPTEALTVKDGRIHYDPALCFNCADCIRIRRKKGCLKRSDHPGMNTS